MALFLLPSNLLRLREKFLDLRPGSRIVSNTFSIQDWQADETVTVDNCEQWCTVMLYIVPAKIGGTWRDRVGRAGAQAGVSDGVRDVDLRRGQATQVSGSLRGSDLTLKAGTRAITGRVQGNQIDGTVTDGSAKAPGAPRDKLPTHPRLFLPTRRRRRSPQNLREVVGDAVRVGQPDRAQAGAEVAERCVDLHALRLRLRINRLHIRHDVLNPRTARVSRQSLPEAPHGDGRRPVSIRVARRAEKRILHWLRAL